jgi:hypothetical protein
LHIERPQLGAADFYAENVRRDLQLPNDRSRKALSWMWGPHPKEPGPRHNDMFKLQDAVLLALPGRVEGAQT